ncbi:ADP-ribosylation factor-like protein 4 [Sarotherodon galilaeus]
MDLHRAAFKMESSSYLPNPLASPALMVLASTAEASRDASIPCQQPRPFGVPVSVEKDVHLPFNNGSYTFASMYHRQGAVPPGFPNRDFPPSLLHLHHQFAPPNLDCSPISMLNHSGVGAFRPFASPPEDRDGAPGGYQSAFTPAKRLKGCLDAESSPHLRYSDAEGKEYDFGGAQIPPGGSPSSALKAVEDSGKKIFAVSGLLSDRETSSSPEDRIERCKKKMSLYDSQAPVCPICQVLLRPGELQEHMETEIERLATICLRAIKAICVRHRHALTSPTRASLATHFKSHLSFILASFFLLAWCSMLLSVHIKREGESPVVSPLSSEDAHHSDRYQTFLRVRANRQTRLNARIGKMKRRKPEEGGQVCPLCSAPLAGSEEEMSRHVEQCLIQREGALGDDDSADMDGENGRGFEEYEWAGQKRIRATALLEGGFRATGFATCSIKESAADSDADLDVDGDDTLEYGKAQYTEADIIPCSGAGEDQGEAREREALRGAVLNGGMPSNRITPEFSKWANDEMPSTSNGESSKTDPSTPSSSSSSSSAPRTCKNSEIEKVTEEESTATTMEALKARIRELEKQILRGDRYKCLICMDSYTMPLTSIQCWHVHCEECWLRTLGNKKLCPQCNTITSPGDLRRVYL